VKPDITDHPGETASDSGPREPNRRERRFEQPRGEILRAAREVMLERGAEGLSLREVARRAEFSPAALYKYYDGRDAIIAALTQESFRSLNSYLESVAATLTPDERIVELGMAYMRFAQENPADLLAILNSTSADLPPGTDLSLGFAAAHMLADTLREGVASGIFRIADASQVPVIAWSIWVLVHGMSVLSSIDLRQVHDSVRAEPRAVLEAYVESLEQRA
jgi:AcrR family transcriptional regulator